MNRQRAASVKGAKMFGTQNTRGTCVFCENSYTRTGMSRHLTACKARKAVIATEDTEHAPQAKLYHLAIKGTHNPIFWLDIEVPAGATLYALDQFLRDIWLECCEHLSLFKIEGRSYQSTLFDDWWGSDDQAMDVQLGDVLRPGLEFSHKYDFGSTTHLTLRVVAERKGTGAERDGIAILARNDPLDFRCEECADPATVICVFCDYPLLCEKCAETHDCGDEGFLPVVNSPRLGVCGYTGDAW
jgi:hypothetical protein